MKTPLTLLLPLAAAMPLVLAFAEDKPATPKTPAPEASTKTMETGKVIKTDEEWRQKLTPEQFAITRRAATERANGAAYEKFEKEGEGTYYCVCCGGELFTSKEKFHSGCGWPSFYDSSKANNVLERADDSHGMRRVETVCKRCEAHLGHVFEKEGFKTPTDRRFCINGAALVFVPKGGTPPKLEELSSPEVAKKKDEVKKAAGE
ncbi:peptide-methionine (R)-S-oxide reductase MsrB [Roseimicrobium sp. ORNL1]|uniref:peptide-methionine (R)-S-oxide reductase MsrB n=1 Tax=Roseimicrobium sp. ORNL1 TaxID=2711231 RepID=UPI001F0D0F07|nr:peptide-methionine (R)-S-oxide reductase MsrB [Roseimicrobium sp. ORNL1]